jgi:hypothetical protein
LTQHSTPAETAVEQRRSTRAVLALPIIVNGVDALHEPFRENTNTVMVSCHGCKYQSKHYVPRGSVVELEVPRGQRGAARRISGKVIWVQRPRNTREVFHIAVDFEVPGNVWDIPSPPADWFPVPGDAAPSTPEGNERAAACPGTQAIEQNEAIASWDESEIVSAYRPADQTEAEDDTQTEEELDVVEMFPGDIAANGNLRQIIENTVKAAVARFAKKIAEEAREERIAAAAQLDAKVQQAVEAAITRLPSIQLKKSKQRN